jgi:hypothetical protein
VADIDASNWNEDDNSNSTAAPDGFPEGMSPSGVNNGARAIMGALKRQRNHQSPKTTAGSPTTYTLSYTVAPGALYDGATHLVQFNATNGAAATLNINALGAKPLYTYQSAGWAAAPAGVLTTDMIAPVAYDSVSGVYLVLKIEAAGTWTPTDASGAGLTFTNVSAKYQVIGNMVYAYFRLTYPSTASGAGASIGGLPVTVPNQTYALNPAPVQFSGGATPQYIVPVQGASTANFAASASASGLTNANMSTLTPNACLIYPAS